MSDFPADRGSAGHASPERLTPEAQVILSQEQLSVDTEWIPSRTVRIRRRVITETRTVEVTVRRTVLDVDGDSDTNLGRAADPAGSTAPGDTETARSTAAPVVIVLAEEVPQVTTVVRPYERVTVHVERVADTAPVAADLAAERVEIETPPDRR